jgi:hypothetical protein
MAAPPVTVAVGHATLLVFSVVVVVVVLDELVDEEVGVRRVTVEEGTGLPVANEQEVVLKVVGK